MNKESVEDLRFDRRLRHRPDWIQDTDLEAHLAALPDVSEKMTTCADEEERTTEAAASATAPTAPTTPLTPPSTETAVPTAGDFSTSRPFAGFGSESDGS